MNLREAAEYLTERGYRCKPGTVRRLAKSGALKHYRPGPTRRGRIEFRPEQLDRFLREAEIGGPAGEAPAPAPAPARPRKPRPKPEPKSSDWKSELASIAK